MKQVIKNLYESEDSIEFRSPVEYEALMLYDYPSVILNPMDLGTIKTNVEN